MLILWYILTSIMTHIYRAKLKLERLKRRGKAPPKKGAGKRASKKK
jgi:hypothetical protein